MNIGTPLLAFSNEKPHWGKSAAIKCNYIATCTVAPIFSRHPSQCFAALKVMHKYGGQPEEDKEEKV